MPLSNGFRPPSLELGAGSDRWLKLALSLWTLCLLVILVRMLVVAPGRRSLYPIYGSAAQTWRAGQDLYPTEKKDCGFPFYRYSPAVAALMAPLGSLPLRSADLLWHFINWAALLGGLLWWSRAVLGLADRETIGKLLVLVLPLAIGNLNNGQSNSLVLAALLGGMAAAAGERWNLAAVLIAVACLFKVYPIAVGLLLSALYPRRFALRLAGALALGLALPFLLQDPAYVHKQYLLWLNYLRLEDRTTWPIFYTNIDFQLLCRVWLAPLSPRTYRLIQLAAAALIGLICLAARRWPTRRLLAVVLGLGCVWMTVFGPATESPTYVLLAPTAAWAVLSAWRDHRSHALRALLLSAYLLLVSAQVVAWFAGLFLPYRALGPQPFAGLLLAAGLTMLLLRAPAKTGRLATLRGSVAGPTLLRSVAKRLHLGAVLLIVLLAGSAQTADPPAITPGIVYVVGGVGGFDHVGRASIKALPRAGVPHEIHEFIWTHGLGQMLKDLQDTDHMTRKAADLAAKVRLYRKLHPDRPIYLIGKSGGAGLVLRTAEMLPPDTVDRIILLSAAVSPKHDLRPALRATKYEIVSFYSKYDWFILGWGTWQFGTADRVYSASAGLCGFTRPPADSPDAALYRRLVEIPWTPAMIPEGYFAGHIGTSNSAFVAKEVAPWLMH